MNREVMVKALNVIKDSVVNTDFPLTNKFADAIYAIEVELAKPEQEPVAWMVRDQVDGCRYPSALKNPAGSINGESQPLYTAPSRKEWVGLTGIEVRMLKDIHIPMYSIPTLDDYLNFYCAIENELKDKNTTNQ